MKIELNQKEYRNLIRAVEIGNSVYGILGDLVDEKKYKKTSLEVEALQEKLLSFAPNFNCLGMVERYENRLILNDEWSDKISNDLDEYDDENFWSELETSLGKRDFMRDIKPEEIEYISKNDWLPERINDFYQKWQDEFADNGLDRLDIVWRGDLI
ncbi:MAG TPA: hypothetical protein PK142_02230 [bacterium]|nr:hypothetical protein [bacterium]